MKGPPMRSKYPVDTTDSLMDQDTYLKYYAANGTQSYTPLLTNPSWTQTNSSTISTKNIVRGWTVTSSNVDSYDDDWRDVAIWVEKENGTRRIVGKEFVGQIELLDGTIIKCDKGNAEIIYSDGDSVKRVYRPCKIHDFNKFLNASDMLEQFLQEVAPLARSKHEFLNLPIELFIKWLVIKAAEQDGEAAPQEVSLPVPLLPAPRRHIHRCRSCQRFIPRKRYDAGVFFCKPEHMTRYLEKVA